MSELTRIADEARKKGTRGFSGQQTDKPLEIIGFFCENPSNHPLTMTLVLPDGNFKDWSDIYRFEVKHDALMHIESIILETGQISASVRQGSSLNIKKSNGTVSVY